MPRSFPPTPSLNKKWLRSNHEQRRRIIVDTALKTLRQSGIKAVSMRNVSTRLGIGTMTLYTYVKGQDQLHREMVLSGFRTLSEGCRKASTLDSKLGWRGGARFYIKFATQNPNLYDLMFKISLPRGTTDIQIIQAGIQPLFDRVRDQMIKNGCSGPHLDKQVKQSAGRFWIALHGLASLAVADRVSILDNKVDQLLDDLLKCVSPT
jgi:AcrR family transcriptional regulator